MTILCLSASALILLTVAGYLITCKADDLRLRNNAKRFATLPCETRITAENKDGVVVISEERF